MSVQLSLTPSMMHMPIEELWACIVDFSQELAAKSAALVAAEIRVQNLEAEITTLKAKIALPVKRI